VYRDPFFAFPLTSLLRFGCAVVWTAACSDAPAPTPKASPPEVETSAPTETTPDETTPLPTVTTPPEEPPPSLPMFLLAGQSNMEGNVDERLFTNLLAELSGGSDDDLPLRLDAVLDHWYFVFDEGYASYGHTEAMAELQIESLISLRDQGLLGPDLTAPHADVLCSFNGDPAPLAMNCGYPFGPELMFGHQWAAAGNTTTSLIKVARGGTTLFVDWRPPSSGGEVGSDYLRLQQQISVLSTDPARVNPACAEQACHWAAFIWFQGENDSFERSHASSYEANLRSLLADVRSEVGDPLLPVIVVQTGAWAQSLEFGAGVAAAQQRIVDEDEHAQLIVTDDLSGFYHYDPAAQLIIGQRIADAVQGALDAR
jgi:hypothetical protein